MKLENGKVTPAQITFGAACFIQASSLLSSILIGVTDTDSWFAVVLGFIACIPIMLIFLGLIKTFPGKNLIEMNEIAFGRIIGTVASIIQILFFLTMVSLNLRDLNSFAKETIMDKTPDIVLMGTCIIVSSLAIRYGIETVMRYGFIFIVISSIVLILSILMSINNMDLNNFLPLLQKPAAKYVQGANIVLSVPFGELVVFLMIAPYVHDENRKFGRFFLGGYLLGGILYLLAVVRDTAVLGNTIVLFSMPAFETHRLIELFGALSRMEILFSSVLLLLLFYRITLLYYAVVLATAQIFRLKSYKPIIWTVGVIIIGYSFTLFTSNVQLAQTARRTGNILWQLLETVIPVLILICGVVKKRAKKNKEAEM